jgi:hypothetical protein
MIGSPWEVRMSETGAQTSWGTNPARTATITWSVADSQVSKGHSVTDYTPSNGVIGPNLSYVDTERTLGIAATINGRTRSEDVSVDRDTFERVSNGGAYTTNGRRFLSRFWVRAIAWLILYVACWVLLFSPLYILMLAPLITLFVLSPFLATATIDWRWWSGHGFVNEVRSKWIIATILWALTVVPLVMLSVDIS